MTDLKERIEGWLREWNGTVGVYRLNREASINDLAAYLAERLGARPAPSHAELVKELHEVLIDNRAGSYIPDRVHGVIQRAATALEGGTQK